MAAPALYVKWISPSCLIAYMTINIHWTWPHVWCGHCGSVPVLYCFIISKLISVLLHALQQTLCATRWKQISKSLLALFMIWVLVIIWSFIVHLKLRRWWPKRNLPELLQSSKCSWLVQSLNPKPMEWQYISKLGLCQPGGRGTPVSGGDPLHLLSVLFI